MHAPYTSRIHTIYIMHIYRIHHMYIHINTSCTYIIYIMHTHTSYTSCTYSHTVIIMIKKKNSTKRVKGSSELHLTPTAGFKRPTLLLLEGIESTCAQGRVP